MSRSRDDGILDVTVKLCKVSQIACNTYDEASVLLRILLGSTQGRVIDHVDLDVLTAFLKVCLDYALDGVDALLSFDTLRVETEIEQSAGLEILRLQGSDGFHGRRRSVDISSHHWGGIVV